MWSEVLGFTALVAVAAYLALRFKQRRLRQQEERDRFFASIRNVLERSRLENTGSVGYPRLAGEYQGFPVQVLPVVDTLGVRRLPALWLLATLQAALPIRSRFDLMMRPAGPTTFSNFDFLPHTVQTPSGFPEHAVVRTDDPAHLLPVHVIEPHLDVFNDHHAKELLITPQGVRLVWLLAEGSRARYGVFREADFGPIEVDPDLVRGLLERLVAIRKTVIDWAAR